MENVHETAAKSKTKQPWLRLYRASLHSPKIVSLSDRQHRAWHNCLLIADNDGALPSMRDIAVHMRMTTTEAEQLICDLVEAGLVDPVMDGTRTTYVMHDWQDHQPPSDTSTERVQKHRLSKRNVTVTDVKRSSNVIESESDIESETEKKFLPLGSEVPAAKVNELRFGLGLKNGKAGRVDVAYLGKRAEGLGLDAADLIGTTNRAAPKKPTAYMTTLCVNKLKERLPGIDEKVVRDALWGQDKQYGVLCQILLEHAP